MHQTITAAGRLLADLWDLEIVGEFADIFIDWLQYLEDATIANSEEQAKDYAAELYGDCCEQGIILSEQLYDARRRIEHVLGTVGVPLPGRRPWLGEWGMVQPTAVNLALDRPDFLALKIVGELSARGELITETGYGESLPAAIVLNWHWPTVRASLLEFFEEENLNLNLWLLRRNVDRELQAAAAHLKREFYAAAEGVPLKGGDDAGC